MTIENRFAQASAYDRNGNYYEADRIDSELRRLAQAPAPPAPQAPQAPQIPAAPQAPVAQTSQQTEKVPPSLPAQFGTLPASLQNINRQIEQFAMVIKNDTLTGQTAQLVQELQNRFTPKAPGGPATAVKHFGRIAQTSQPSPAPDTTVTLYKQLNASLDELAQQTTTLGQMYPEYQATNQRAHEIIIQLHNIIDTAATPAGVPVASIG